MSLSSVIVNYLDRVGVSVSPFEAYFPLIIDADAVLAFSITLEFFKTVAGRYAQVFQCLRSVQGE